MSINPLTPRGSLLTSKSHLEQITKNDQFRGEWNKNQGKSVRLQKLQNRVAQITTELEPTGIFLGVAGLVN